MFRISACYGEPTDTNAFDVYYTKTHVPLALKLPGLKEFTTGKCQSLTPGEPPAYYMIASLTFDSSEALLEALNSPEMAAAVADVPNFATGGLSLYTTEEISRM